MKISSQTHYGLQASIILAKSYPNCVSATELEKKIGVSKKYLERIMRKLSSERIVVASRGVNGGYALCDNPNEVSCGVVIRALENDLKIVDCVDNPCAKLCDSVVVWRKLYIGINDLLNDISLYSIINGLDK